MYRIDTGYHENICLEPLERVLAGGFLRCSLRPWRWGAGVALGLLPLWVLGVNLKTGFTRNSVSLPAQVITGQQLLCSSAFGALGLA